MHRLPRRRACRGSTAASEPCWSAWCQHLQPTSAGEPHCIREHRSGPVSTESLGSAVLAATDRDGSSKPLQVSAAHAIGTAYSADEGDDLVCCGALGS